MDPTRFDRLAQSLGRATSRRTTLAALLGGFLASVSGPDVPAKGDRRGRSEHRKAKRDREPGKAAAPSSAVTSTCCASGSCSPGPGKNLSHCCFEARNLARANFRGTNLSGASFRGATLTNADFRAANLTGACLVDADIQGARFGGANQSGVIRCRTKTDTGIDNSGCAKGTACCPTEEPGPQTCTSPADCPDQPCQTKACQNGQCAYTPVADGASPNGLCTTHCCEGVCCGANATACNPQGLCCVPNCPGERCGPDGCGGECAFTCPSGSVCDESSGQCVCTPRSCPNGCCDASGICRPGNTGQNCGTGGAACDRCTAQEQCVSGACVPVTCAGACSNDNDCPDLRNCVCNRAQQTCCGRNCTGKVCGPDGCGGACENLCPPNTVCNGNGTACLCTPQSCPNGCCDAGNLCQTGNTNQACGLPGQTCATCTGQEICQNGRCVCIPKTCAELGRSCGTAPDGCGGTLSCGTCPVGPTPSCSNSGVCVGCPAVCGGACVNLANGDTRCCDNIDINCGLGCSSNANCTGGGDSVCVTSFTTGGQVTPPNQTTTIATLCQGIAAAICVPLSEC